MLTQEQLEQRRSGLGGSDAPVALGLSKWRTPLDLYLDKLGVPTGDNVGSEKMRWGNLLEPVIANEWSARMNKQLGAPGLLRSEDYPFMLANVDGLLVNEPAGLEIKTVSGPACAEWGDEGTDEIPLYYLVQVYHYAIVTRRRRWYVAALFNGSELRTYVVDARDDLMATVVEREREFWRCVETRQPPAPLTAAEASRMFPVSTTRNVEATPEVAAAVVHLSELRGARDQLDERMDEPQRLIMEFMGDADTLTLAGRTLATWKSAKPSNRIDLDALRKDAPDVAAQFTRTVPGSRRFLLN